MERFACWFDDEDAQDAENIDRCNADVAAHRYCEIQRPDRDVIVNVWRASDDTTLQIKIRRVVSYVTVRE